MNRNEEDATQGKPKHRFSVWVLLRQLVVFAVTAAITAFFVNGARDSWELLAGKPVPGPVDFATLERRSTPNDALACNPQLCPAAKSDFVSPVYELDAAALATVFARMLVGEERTEIMPRDEDDVLHAVTFSKWLSFPDLVTVQFFGAGEGRSTLAIYVRAQLGYGDMGANRARIGRWLEKLKRHEAATGG